MNCEEHQEGLSAFLDGERDTQRIGESFSHLYDCPLCREFWDGIVEIAETAANDTTPFPAHIDRTVYAARRRKNRSTLFEWHIRIPRLALGVSVLVLLVLGFAGGYIVGDTTSQRAVTMQIPENALPTRVVYVYAIPGATVYANDGIQKGSRELQPAIDRKNNY